MDNSAAYNAVKTYKRSKRSSRTYRPSFAQTTKWENFIEGDDFDKLLSKDQNTDKENIHPLSIDSSFKYKHLKYKRPLKLIRSNNDTGYSSFCKKQPREKLNYAQSFNRPGKHYLYADESSDTDSEIYDFQSSCKKPCKKRKKPNNVNTKYGPKNFTTLSKYKKQFSAAKKRNVTETSNLLRRNKYCSFSNMAVKLIIQNADKNNENKENFKLRTAVDDANQFDSHDFEDNLNGLDNSLDFTIDHKKFNAESTRIYNSHMSSWKPAVFELTKSFSKLQCEDNENKSDVTSNDKFSSCNLSEMNRQQALNDITNCSASKKSEVSDFSQKDSNFDKKIKTPFSNTKRCILLQDKSNLIIDDPVSNEKLSTDFPEIQYKDPPLSNDTFGYKFLPGANSLTHNVDLSEPCVNSPEVVGGMLVNHVSVKKLTPVMRKVIYKTYDDSTSPKSVEDGSVTLTSDNNDSLIVPLFGKKKIMDKRHADCTKSSVNDKSSRDSSFDLNFTMSSTSINTNNSEEQNSSEYDFSSCLENMSKTLCAEQTTNNQNSINADTAELSLVNCTKTVYSKNNQSGDANEIDLCTSFSSLYVVPKPLFVDPVECSITENLVSRVSVAKKDDTSNYSFLDHDLIKADMNNSTNSVFTGIGEFSLSSSSENSQQIDRLDHPIHKSFEMELDQSDNKTICFNKSSLNSPEVSNTLIDNSIQNDSINESLLSCSPDISKTLCSEPIDNSVHHNQRVIHFSNNLIHDESALSSSNISKTLYFEQIDDSIQDYSVGESALNSSDVSIDKTICFEQIDNSSIHHNESALNFSDNSIHAESARSSSGVSEQIDNSINNDSVNESSLNSSEVNNTLIDHSIQNDSINESLLYRSPDVSKTLCSEQIDNSVHHNQRVLHFSNNSIHVESALSSSDINKTLCSEQIHDSIHDDSVGESALNSPDISNSKTIFIEQIDNSSIHQNEPALNSAYISKLNNNEEKAPHEQEHDVKTFARKDNNLYALKSIMKIVPSLELSNLEQQSDEAKSKNVQLLNSENFYIQEKENSILIDTSNLLENKLLNSPVKLVIENQLADKMPLSNDYKKNTAYLGISSIGEDLSPILPDKKNVDLTRTIKVVTPDNCTPARKRNGKMNICFRNVTVRRPLRKLVPSIPEEGPELSIFDDQYKEMSPASVSHNIVNTTSIYLPAGKKYRRSLITLKTAQMVGDSFNHTAMYGKGRNYFKNANELILRQNKTIFGENTLYDQTVNTNSRKNCTPRVLDPVREEEDSENENYITAVQNSTFFGTPLKATFSSTIKPLYENQSILDLCCDNLSEEDELFYSEEADNNNYTIGAGRFDVAAAKYIVLNRCHQTCPLPFEECFPDRKLKNCRKIGEGVYGEVFMIQEKKGQCTVLKLIPIEGDKLVNGERQKKYEEIMSEIVISLELSNLREGFSFYTDSFCKIHRCWCVQGKYPERLIDLWDEYDEIKGSENDSPTMFTEEQLYIALELENGGEDVETFQFNNAQQALSVVKQTAFAIAVAQETLEFEHRDLHWGNVLVSETKKKDTVYRIRDKRHCVKLHGVKVTIIDFTLSRIKLNGLTIYNDMSKDPELFTAEGDFQFEVYRLMRNEVKNVWDVYAPKTNVIWLQYLLDKFLHNVKYKRINSKAHKNGLTKIRELYECVTKAADCYDFILSNNLY